jgi:hypothetical protein
MGQQPNPERTDEENRREWEEILALREGRFRARLRAENLDSDLMSEEEEMDYIDRAIHEQRQKERAERDKSG